MVKIIWSELAIEDLKIIYDYISKDSIRYAARMIDKIIHRIDQLENFPGSGRIVPEFNNDSIREIIVDNYRIIYLVKKDSVNITRIHHAARDII